MDQSYKFPNRPAANPAQAFLCAVREPLRVQRADAGIHTLLAD